MTEVQLPPAGYVATPEMTALWDRLGAVIEEARRTLGDDRALSVVLSRVSRELRRTLGPDEAASVLRQLADQQHQAARNDR